MIETDHKRKIILQAAQEYKRKNIAQAELLCRHLLRNFGDDADALNLLGIIAIQVQETDLAKEYFQRALAMGPGNTTIAKNLASAEHVIAQKKQMPVNTDNPGIRYHVIKSWGCGFWSDINHVLGHLLLAELTQRRPFVLWGGNSLFSDSEKDNAYEYFFEPPSTTGLPEVTRTGQTYFPPKWNRDNLTRDDINKWDGPYSRMAGLYYLNRAETITVGDFAALVTDLVDWLPASHPMRGQSLAKHYRHLFRKHLRPRDEHMHLAENFYQEHLARHTSLAVHIRGSDKILEQPELEATNRAYPAHIDAFLRMHPDARIFLLTDSSTIHRDFCQRYRDRIVSRECARTGNEHGVHFLAHASRKEIGREVLLDTLIAGQCDYFIGNGDSSVSNAIYHLKDWDEETANLLGGCRWYHSNLALHGRKNY